MRICICIADDDLRAWVMDELALITWVVQPTVITTGDLSTIDPRTISALVVGVDGMAAQDLDRVRAWPIPVIAIGRDARIAGAHVLGPGLTSRELKHAIRTALF